MHRTTSLLAILVLLVTAAPAIAVDPLDRCVFDNTPQLTFGTYDVLSPFDQTSSGLMQFTCKGKDFTVVVSLSRGSSNNNLSRTLIQTAHHDALYYNVYTDAGHGQIWGDGTFGSNPVVVIAKNNTRVTLPMYGRIPAGQNVIVGLYDDSLVVTLQF